MIKFANENVTKRFEACTALAITMGGDVLESWNRCCATLERLGGEKGATLYWDFAPYSFGFDAGGFSGGFIFHGKAPGEAKAETFAVTMEPCDGWSIHT